MDNLTHSFVAGALAKSGLERHTPLATATLVLAANAPDVDILAYAWGPYHALSFRRGITHGIPGLLVLCVAVTGVMLAWDRWVRRKEDPSLAPARPRALFLLAAIGLATHPILDWMNTYGIRWWMPFDGSWSYGDALFIVDPWLWLGLGGALFITGSVTVPARLGWAAGCLVTSALILVAPIGIIAKILWVVGIAAAIGVRMLQHRDPAATHEAQRRDRRLHRSTSVLVAAYLLMMVVLNGMAVREVGKTLSPTGTQPPQDIMVAPAPAHPLRSDIVALVRGQFVPGTYEWLRSPQVVMSPDGAVEGVRIGDGIRPDQADVAITEAIQDPDVEDFLAWSRFPLVTVDREEDGFVVRFGDARHLGIGSSSPGGLEVRLTSELRRIDPNG